MVTGLVARTGMIRSAIFPQNMMNRSDIPIRRGEQRPSWKHLLAQGQPLVLPAAHDALTARLIQRAGFPAYQIGGFALNGARHAFPDLDLAILAKSATRSATS